MIATWLEAISPALRDLLDPPATTREAIRRDNLRRLLPAMTIAREPSQRSRAALLENDE